MVLWEKIRAESDLYYAFIGLTMKHRRASLLKDYNSLPVVTNNFIHLRQIWGRIEKKKI